MSTNAEYYQGTVLKISSDMTSASYVTFPDVELIDGPNYARDQLRVTTLDSGQWQEYTGGLTDGGELTFKINYIPTNTAHKVILTAIADGGTTGGRRMCRIDPGGSTSKSHYGLAVVTGHTMNGAAGEILTAQVKLKLSGAWTTP